jgi:hypothetical protein
MTINDNALFIAQHLRDAEEKVSSERGGFSLFGLFERERTPGRWDLIVSAPWLKTDYAGTKEIIALLRDKMGFDDWQIVSAVFPLEPSVEYVRWFTQRYHVEHQLEEFYNAVFNGVSVSRAFIITANPSPASVMPQAVAA